MNHPTAQNLRDRYGLSPHPEGGWYKEVYRSTDEVFNEQKSPQSALSSIYYMLENQQFSAFHQLDYSEIWYFHLGVPLELILLYPDGTLERLMLHDSAHLQCSIEPGVWFAAHLPSKYGFTFVSCAVAPGFLFSAFRLANAQQLGNQFPQHKQIIHQFSRH